MSWLAFLVTENVVLQRVMPCSFSENFGIIFLLSQIIILAFSFSFQGGK
jgi:glucose-6-phosphate-specific signal transduction histidine kinase